MASTTVEKVVAVFPTGGEAAKEPRYVNCVENGLGLPEFLKGRAEFIVTSDKEGKDSGEPSYSNKTSLLCLFIFVLNGFQNGTHQKHYAIS